jgi:TRAP-type mannitol/chloroaromatic compound transport system substrate-binding protein
MKLKKIAWLFTAVLVTFFVASLTVGHLTAEAAQEVYKMRIQSAWPRADISMQLLEKFAAAADKRSNGQIKIQVFAAPEIVPGEQTLEATKKGTLDMLHSIGAYWGGTTPIGEIEFGLPLMWAMPPGKTVKENSEIVRDFFLNSGFAELLRKEYAKQGVYWLDMHSYGELFTLSREPIISCADMQGKKFRAEGAWTDFYNNMGARGTFVDGGEAYMALSKGVIDTTQWDVSAVTGMNIHEVAPYRIMGGGNDVVPGHILINLKKWESLPDNLKAALKGAAKDYFDALNDIYMEEMKKVDELVKQGKVKLSYFDDACIKKHEEVAMKLWDEIAKRDPSAVEAVELVKEWRKTLK